MMPPSLWQRTPLPSWLWRTVPMMLRTIKCMEMAPQPMAMSPWVRPTIMLLTEP